MKVLYPHTHRDVYLRTEPPANTKIVYWVVLDDGTVICVTDVGHALPSPRTKEELQQMENQGDMLRVLAPHEVEA